MNRIQRLHITNLKHEKKLFHILILFLGIISTSLAQDNIGSYEDLSSQIIDSAKQTDIICIGEHSHSDMNAINTKARILGDIAQSVPTGALLFEAPLVASVISYLENQSYSEFVWPFWKYKSLKLTLDSIIGTNGIVCLGFDPQETCTFSRFSSFLISRGYIKDDRELSQMDSIISIAVANGSGNKTRNLTETESKLMNEIIEKIKLKLHWQSDIPQTEKSLISLCFENRKYLAKEMTFKNINDQMNFRDSIMALNIKHINEVISPELEQKKVIVWAANLHIARSMSGGIWMMERFLSNNNDDVLSIGIIPRRRKKDLKRFDFAIVSGQPEAMSNDLRNSYECD